MIRDGHTVFFIFTGAGGCIEVRAPSISCTLDLRFIIMAFFFSIHLLPFPAYTKLLEGGSVSLILETEGVANCEAK